MSRFAEVDKDGAFSIKGDPRMVYQIMVQTRIKIILGAYLHMFISAKWATRYAVCRRQFSTIDGSS